MLLEIIEHSLPVVFNQALLSQLADVGFLFEACKRAFYFTKNSDIKASTT